MASTSGQVTFNDEPTKTKLYRFCEKKIDQWLESRLTSTAGHRSEAALNELPAEFRVIFSEESEPKQVSCVTEICFAGAKWRGCDLACDTQQAFIQSLKRLQPH